LTYREAERHKLVFGDPRSVLAADTLAAGAELIEAVRGARETSDGGRCTRCPGGFCLLDEMARASFGHLAVKEIRERKERLEELIFDHGGAIPACSIHGAAAEA
jgi:hypothetical protein